MESEGLIGKKRNRSNSFKEKTPTRDEVDNLRLLVKQDELGLLNPKDFSFGNYRKNYYRRYLECFDNKGNKSAFLKESHFWNKSCLDIGCGEGIMTIILASQFSPKSMEGLDLDHRLVNQAIKNTKLIDSNLKCNDIIRSIRESEEKHSGDFIEDLLKFRDSTKDLKEGSTSKERKIEQGADCSELSMMKTEDLIKKIKSLPKSFMYTQKQEREIDTKSKILQFTRPGLNSQEGFPSNVFFSTGNALTEDQTRQSKFNTITCLSTVKWIHLNYGDLGVKVLFDNVYNWLAPGGLFILDIPEWKSYQRRKKLNQRIKSNYYSIRLKPSDFSKYLQQVYSFKLVDEAIPYSNSNRGYERQILVLKKENNKI